MTKKFLINTPLAAIGAFVAVVEAVITISIPRVTGTVQIALTVFVIAFAILIAAAFFSILWFKPYVFYPPSEYGEHARVREFVEAIAQRPTSNRFEEDSYKLLSIEEIQVVEASASRATDSEEKPKSEGKQAPVDDKKTDSPAEWASAWAKGEYRLGVELLSKTVFWNSSLT